MRINEPIWIEINLPWNVFDVGALPSGPNLKELKERERQDLGQTIEESESSVDDIPIDCIRLFNRGDTEALNESDRTLLANHRAFVNRWNEWRNKQPEVLTYQKDWAAKNIEIKLRSFCGRGLNIPGTVIEIANGRRYLIGDINELGGKCDDCKAIKDDEIVIRYTVVWNEA